MIALLNCASEPQGLVEAPFVPLHALFDILGDAMPSTPENETYLIVGLSQASFMQFQGTPTGWAFLLTTMLNNLHAGGMQRVAPTTEQKALLHDFLVQAVTITAGVQENIAHWLAVMGEVGEAP